MKIYYNNKTGCSYICDKNKKKKRKRKTQPPKRPPVVEPPVVEPPVVDPPGVLCSKKINISVDTNNILLYSQPKADFNRVTQSYQCLPDMQLKVNINESLNVVPTILWSRISNDAYQDEANSTNFYKYLFDNYNSPIIYDETKSGTDRNTGKYYPFYQLLGSSNTMYPVNDIRYYSEPNIGSIVVPTGSYMNYIGLTAPYFDTNTSNPTCSTCNVVGAILQNYNIYSTISNKLRSAFDNIYNWEGTLQTFDRDDQENYLPKKLHKITGIHGITDKIPGFDDKNYVDYGALNDKSQFKMTYTYDQSFTYIQNKRFLKALCMDIINISKGSEDDDTKKKHIETVLNNALTATVTYYLDFSNIVQQYSNSFKGSLDSSGFNLNSKFDPKTEQSSIDTLINQLRGVLVDEKKGGVYENVYIEDKTDIKYKTIWADCTQPLSYPDEFNRWSSYLEGSDYRNISVQYSNMSPEDFTKNTNIIIGNRSYPSIKKIVGKLVESYTIVQKVIVKDPVRKQFTTDPILGPVMASPFFEKDSPNNTEELNNTFLDSIVTGGIYWSDNLNQNNKPVVKYNFQNNTIDPSSSNYIENNNLTPEYSPAVKYNFKNNTIDPSSSLYIKGNNLTADYSPNVSKLTTVLIDINEMNNFFSGLTTLKYNMVINMNNTIYILQLFNNDSKTPVMPIIQGKKGIVTLSNEEDIKTFHAIEPQSSNIFTTDNGIVTKPIINSDPSNTDAQTLIHLFDKYKFLCVWTYTKSSLYLNIIPSNKMIKSFGINNIADNITGLLLKSNNLSNLGFSGNYKKSTVNNNTYIYKSTDEYKISFTGDNHYLSPYNASSTTTVNQQYSYIPININITGGNDYVKDGIKYKLKYNSISYFYISLIIAKLKLDISNLGLSDETITTNYGIIYTQVGEINNNSDKTNWQITYNFYTTVEDGKIYSSKIQKYLGDFIKKFDRYLVQYNLVNPLKESTNIMIPYIQISMKKVNIIPVNKGYIANAIYTKESIVEEFNSIHPLSHLATNITNTAKKIVTGTDAVLKAYSITDVKVDQDASKIGISDINNNRLLFKTRGSFIGGVYGINQNPILSPKEININENYTIVDNITITKIDVTNTYFSGIIDYASAYAVPLTLFNNAKKYGLTEITSVFNANLIQFYNQFFEKDKDKQYCNYNSIFTTYMQTGYGRDSYLCAGNGPSLLAIHQNNEAKYNNISLMNIAVGKPLSECGAYNGIVRKHPSCYVKWAYGVARTMTYLKESNPAFKNYSLWDSTRVTNRVYKDIYFSLMFWALGEEATLPQFREIGIKDNTNCTSNNTTNNKSWLLEKLKTPYDDVKEIPYQSIINNAMFFVYVDNINNMVSNSIDVVSYTMLNFKPSINLNLIYAFATTEVVLGQNINTCYDLYQPTYNSDGTTSDRTKSLWGNDQISKLKSLELKKKVGWFNPDNLKSSRKLILRDGFIGVWMTYISQLDITKLSNTNDNDKIVTSVARKNNNIGQILFSYGGANENIGLTSGNMDPFILGQMIAFTCFKNNFDGVDLDLENINKNNVQISWITSLHYSIKMAFYMIEYYILRYDSATFHYAPGHKFLLTDAPQPLYFDVTYFQTAMAGNTYPIKELIEVETKDDTNPIIYYNPDFDDKKYKKYNFVDYRDCGCMRNAQDKSSCVTKNCNATCLTYEKQLPTS